MAEDKAVKVVRAIPTWVLRPGGHLDVDGDGNYVEVVENEPRRTYFFSGGHWHWTTGSAPKRSVETDDKAPATNEGDEGFKTSDDV